MTTSGWQLVGEAAVAQAEGRARGCARPVRLTGQHDPRRRSDRCGAVRLRFGR